MEVSIKINRFKNIADNSIGRQGLWNSHFRRVSILEGKLEHKEEINGRYLTSYGISRHKKLKEEIDISTITAEYSTLLSQEVGK